MVNMLPYFIVSFNSKYPLDSIMATAGVLMGIIKAIPEGMVTIKTIMIGFMFKLRATDKATGRRKATTAVLLMLSVNKTTMMVITRRITVVLLNPPRLN